MSNEDVEWRNPYPDWTRTPGPGTAPTREVAAQFLAARYDEEEAAARATAFSPWESIEYEESEDHVLRGEFLVEGVWPAGRRGRFEHDQGDPSDPVRVVETEDAATADHIAFHDPAHVLADIKAKRAVLDLVADEYPHAVLLLLQPYRDRPDFDPAWRTE